VPTRLLEKMQFGKKLRSKKMLRSKKEIVRNAQ
jgi:hypothetical protein